MNCGGANCLTKKKTKTKTVQRQPRDSSTNTRQSKSVQTVQPIQDSPETAQRQSNQYKTVQISPDSSTNARQSRNSPKSRVQRLQLYNTLTNVKCKGYTVYCATCSTHRRMCINQYIQYIV